MQTFDPHHFGALVAIEQRHAWFRARNKMIGERVAEVTSDLPDGFRVLEVGCGSGSVLQVLERVCTRGEVVGLDLYEEGLQFARARTGCTLVRGDANCPPFGQEFAVVGMFDVLEHLPDDMGVLRRMSEILLPDGMLLLTVPADPALWSYFDEAAHHARRYTLPELEQKLTSSGFDVEYISHFMMPLHPIMRLYRGLGRRRGADTVERDLKIVPVFNELLYWTLRQENWAFRNRKQLPLGTSIFAMARWKGPE
ncbi:MAG: methyltransferase domain-containing protein [Chloroflexota bacterium]|nr:methyltransferase domain-containing protein [Chloroflexota bacterium]